jgi:hypothetical protein
MDDGADPEDTRSTMSGDYGGWEVDMSGAEQQSKSLSKEARDILQSLERLFKALEVAIHGTDSPRIDGTKLVQEIVKRRMSLARCHKTELETRKFVVLCDVSGSCAQVARPTLAAAKAIYDANPERVIVIAHSNG